MAVGGGGAAFKADRKGKDAAVSYRAAVAALGLAGAAGEKSAEGIVERGTGGRMKVGAGKGARGKLGKDGFTDTKGFFGFGVGTAQVGERA